MLYTTFIIKHICFLYCFTMDIKNQWFTVFNNHAIARLVFIFRLQNFTQKVETCKSFLKRFYEEIICVKSSNNFNFAITCNPLSVFTFFNYPSLPHFKSQWAPVSNNHAIARLVFIFRLQNFTQKVETCKSK
jgi:hypothetical protein